MSSGPVITIVLLLAVWMMGHFLSIGILIPKRGAALLFCATVCLLVGYAVKPATFDLPRYSIYFETGVAPWITEYGWKERGWKEEDFHRREVDHPYFQHFPNSPGFVFLMKLSGQFLPHGPYLPRLIKERHIADSLVILVVLLGLLVLWFAILLMCVGKPPPIGVAGSWWWTLTLMLGSVFFFVGSQNSIRQFLGTVLSILAMAAFLRVGLLRTLLGGLALFGAFMFHPWAPAFALLGVVFILARHMSETMTRIEATRLVFNEYLVAFLLGIMGVIAIKVGTKLGLPYFTTYFNIDSSAEVYRTSALTKLGILASILAVTDLVAGRSNSEWRYHPASFRRCFLFFLAPLVIYPEIFSRISMFYFAAEMLYLVWAFGHQLTRVRASGVLVFCAYGLALNCLNILLDRGWVETLFYG